MDLHVDACYISIIDLLRDHGYNNDEMFCICISSLGRMWGKQQTGDGPLLSNGPRRTLQKQESHLVVLVASRFVTL